MKANQQSIFAVIIIVITTLFVATTHAAVVTWDGEADPDRNWTTGLNWNGNTVPLAGDDVDFSATGAGIVQVDTNVNVGSLRILSDGYTLQGNQIAINPSGNWGTLYDIYFGGKLAQINSDLQFQADVAFYSTNYTTVSDRPVINGVISEDGTPRSITFQADSRYKTLSLRGANTYSGGTTVSNMTLEIGDNSALGTGVWTLANGASPTYVYVTKDIALNNAVSFEGNMLFGRYSPLDGTLTLNGPISIAAAGVAIEEYDYLVGERLELAGTITDSGNGFTLRTPQNSEILLDSANDITGTVTWQTGGSGQLFNPGSAGSAVLTLGNDSALGTGTLRIEQYTTLTRSGVVVSDGSLVTIGNNIVLDAGANTSVGVGGWGERSVTLAGEFSSVSGVGMLQINAGSTLAGIGAITADTRVYIYGADATLAPGNTGNVGDLTINGNLDFSGNTANYNVDLMAATATTADQVTVTGDLNLNNANLNLLLGLGDGALSGDWRDAVMFILVNDGTTTGTFNGIADGDTLSLGWMTWGREATVQLSYFGDYLGGTTTGGNDIVLYNLIIPEPSTVVVLALGLVVFPRRRRRLR